MELAHRTDTDPLERAASLAGGATPAPAGIGISVVIPCLDEEETLEACVLRARSTLESLGVEGEVIVADNGSRDRSCELALRADALVVHASLRGYGNALHAGIQAARGEFVVLGDADGSYDFGEIPRLYAKYLSGAELVLGCRLPAGGGVVEPGAMPWTHERIGNPFFSWLARVVFRAPIHDVNCGLRGFSAELYRRLDMRCPGMEFAVELVIKSALVGAVIAEVPITLATDGRTHHPPHQRTIRDGWRTLRYMILMAPGWVYVAPGAFLLALGFTGYGLALAESSVFGARLGVHTLAVASIGILGGCQSLFVGLIVKTFAAMERLAPPSAALGRFYLAVTMERALLAAGLTSVAGVGLLAVAFGEWRAAGFGDLDPARTMRVVLPGVTLVVLGIEMALASFVVGILRMARK